MVSQGGDLVVPPFLLENASNYDLCGLYILNNDYKCLYQAYKGGREIRRHEMGERIVPSPFLY